LIRASQYHYLFSLSLIMLMAAFLSAFINDTAVVALLMPVVIKMSERTGVSPGIYLMPLSFAALLGGVCTLIGTSTNILVSGIVTKYGLEPLGMFEFSSAAIWVTIAGLAYMLFAGAFLLPKDREDKGITRRNKLPRYVTRVKLLSSSPDIGKTPEQSALHKNFKAEIVRVNRWNEIFRPPFPPGFTLQDSDEIKIIINADNLLNVRKNLGYTILPNSRVAQIGKDEKTYKVVIPLGSPLVKAEMPYYRFQNIFDAKILAWRNTEPVLASEDMLNEQVKEGEILIISTEENNMYKMAGEDQVVALKEYESEPNINYAKAFLSVAILAGVMLAAAFGLTKIVISAMVGCLLMISLRVVKPEEAYAAVEWKVIFLLAGVLSMGAALEKTGGAQMIAQGLQYVVGDYSPHIALAFLFFVTFMATNFLSNNATAALIAPIAINLAQLMQVSERPFVIGVMFAASLSFMTPMGYQTNTMIYTPGNYRFSDYIKVGTPLNLIVWAISVVVIPIYFPF
jgi:di/tricarboxylate transporter